MEVNEQIGAEEPEARPKPAKKVLSFWHAKREFFPRRPSPRRQKNRRDKGARPKKESM